MNYKELNANKVFAWIDGALRQMPIIEQTIVNDENPQIVVAYKKKSVNLDAGECFASADDYANNVPIELIVVKPCKLNLRGEDGKWLYYTNENGRVKTNEFCGTIIKRLKAYGNGYEYITTDLPAEWYNDAEICKGMSEFVTINEDGTETTHKGAIRRAMLTDEQRNVVSEIAAAVQKAKDMGVRFVFDFDYYKLLAYNNNDIDAEIMYRGDGNAEEGCQEVDMRIGKFDTGIDFGGLGYDDSLFIHN